jgi:hypothetical protein
MTLLAGFTQLPLQRLAPKVRGCVNRTGTARAVIFHIDLKEIP